MLLDYKNVRDLKCLIYQLETDISVFVSTGALHKIRFWIFTHLILECSHCENSTFKVFTEPWVFFSQLLLKGAACRLYLPGVIWGTGRLMLHLCPVKNCENLIGSKEVYCYNKGKKGYFVFSEVMLTCPGRTGKQHWQMSVDDSHWNIIECLKVKSFIPEEDELESKKRSFKFNLINLAADI